MRSSLSWYFLQVGRASSRLLNALCGGEGDTTFSAYSWYLATDKGCGIGRLRVRIVDAIRYKGHCQDAYYWHREHRLFEMD